MHLLICCYNKLDSQHGSSNRGEATDLRAGKSWYKTGGMKSRSAKAEGVAVKGHLKTRVNTIACYCLCSLPLQHLLWAYGRQLAQPQAR